MSHCPAAAAAAAVLAAYLINIDENSGRVGDKENDDDAEKDECLPVVLVQLLLVGSGGGWAHDVAPPPERGVDFKVEEAERDEGHEAGDDQLGQVVVVKHVGVVHTQVGRVYRRLRHNVDAAVVGRTKLFSHGRTANEKKENMRDCLTI